MANKALILIAVCAAAVAFEDPKKRLADLPICIANMLLGQDVAKTIPINVLNGLSRFALFRHIVEKSAATSNAPAWNQLSEKLEPLFRHQESSDAVSTPVLVPPHVVLPSKPQEEPLPEILGHSRPTEHGRTAGAEVFLRRTKEDPKAHVRLIESIRFLSDQELLVLVQEGCPINIPFSEKTVISRPPQGSVLAIIAWEKELSLADKVSMQVQFEIPKQGSLSPLPFVSILKSSEREGSEKEVHWMVSGDAPYSKKQKIEVRNYLASIESDLSEDADGNQFLASSKRKIADELEKLARRFVATGPTLRKLIT